MRNNNKLLISIVVPTYNRADLIGKTLHTLLEQSYSDIEIIVVDDGSKDNTEEVVKAFTDPRIRYLKKQNEERGAARNYGVRHSNGMYLNFFDSDDIAFPNHISTAVQVIEKYDHPEIFTLGYNVVSGTTVQREIKFDGPVNELLQKQNKLGCNSVFIRRDIIEAYPFSTNRKIAVSEDLLLWLTLSARFTIYGIPVITSSLVQHTQRSMVTDTPERILQRMELVVEALKSDSLYMEKYGNRYLPFVRSEKISAAALSYARLGRKGKAIRSLFNAVTETPSILFSRRFLAVLKYLLLRW